MSEISSSSLIELALDLTNSLATKDRFERLLSTVRHTITCDAVVLLHVQGDFLKPLALQGLTKETLGRRFEIAAHPRFEQLCASSIPLRFASDCPLNDPYDGLVLAHAGDLPVHACMGLPLLADNKLIGLLTLDSISPNVFDDIPKRTLDIIAAMSAATLKTAILLQQLEQHSKHNQQVVAELTHEALVKDGGELIGDSEIMLKLKREINMVAASNFSILIEGETGVGKELVARTLHRQSSRRDGPLVYVNCAALPESLIESELFGHVKGAFTGAERNRVGKFNLASGGTIFLDEIGELPLAVQSKLLRVLQNQEIQVVGKDDVEYVDVRILAATNRQLKIEVEAGRFRADLYHRLSVYPVAVPALRYREGDISLLTGYFIELTRRKLGISQLTLEACAIDMLNQYDWPGNVRELEHVISRAALRARNDSASAIVRIGINHLALMLPAAKVSEPLDTDAASVAQEQAPLMPSERNLKQQTDDFQRKLILQTLTLQNGNWSATAKQLQMDRANLNRLAKRLGVRVSKSVVVNAT
ncbi:MULTISPECIES: nitric oxide reductase transcriptional regulator NorR [unclassified Shewanella]|uniref:nitric oxide reductase transcriptional regulator NorR n=1 Tax=unclassified Shewanella TaxID=196818 RepID=UPI001C7DE4EF|nr:MULTISPECIES: nitric oxide reductase transcriptional regulator NorR [unclassified Shewanella]